MRGGGVFKFLRLNHFMIILVKPIVDYSVRGLCTKEYPGHKKGCPNFNYKKGCPPQVEYFDKVYDLNKPVYAIINEFDLKSHVEKMQKLHPEWSSRKQKCCLYWQPRARKELLKIIKDFLIQNYNYKTYEVETYPEAMGIDITKTLADAGIYLEWPPINIARQIALAAIPIKKNKNFKGGEKYDKEN